jgi:glucokinase
MTIPKGRPRLIADIGGTNARFALASPDAQPYQERVLPVADHDSIVSAINTYLQGLSEPRPVEAALAVALPITGDYVKMTNNERWSFSIEETRKALGFERLLLINDFTALALAVPLFNRGELHQVGNGKGVPKSPIGILGPGTGLGVSGLVWASGHWVPLQTEGGHVTFAPFSEREWAVAWQVQRRYGHTSAERLLSGPGLVNIYQALAELEGKTPEQLTPALITERALAGSHPDCVEAVDIFCAALGTVASNLALTLGAQGGIYIGGGIVPRLGEFFDRSKFRSRFEDKGRFVA